MNKQDSIEIAIPGYGPIRRQSNLQVLSDIASTMHKADEQECDTESQRPDFKEKKRIKTTELDTVCAAFRHYERLVDANQVIMSADIAKDASAIYGCGFGQLLWFIEHGGEGFEEESDKLTNLPL